ncbi:pro-sigmaK processing inhibitor BofA family protein [Thermococcus sp.]
MINVLVFLILTAVVGYLIMKFVWRIIKFLAANTIIGLILVGVLNFLGVTHIELNILNLLIIAVGGIVGVFILVILSWL